MPVRSPVVSALVLLGFLAASFGVAALAHPLVESGLRTWYGKVALPWFSPPRWVYAPMATTMNILISVSAWLVWRAEPSHSRENGLRLWPLQLLNVFAWTGTFFKFHEFGPAIWNLFLLIVSIVLIYRPFARVSTTAGRLILPFLAWSCFTMYVNIGVALLNR